MWQDSLIDDIYTQVSVIQDWDANGTAGAWYATSSDYAGWGVYARVTFAVVGLGPKFELKDQAYSQPDVSVGG